MAYTAAVSKRAIRLSEINNPPSLNTQETVPSFQTMIPSQPTSSSEDRWARYRICPSCHYSFCLYCSATWHGPHTPCAFPQTSLIVQEYLSYPEDSEERKRMELRRGKGNLERMVNKWREDEENKKWLQSKTRACGVRVEKRYVHVLTDSLNGIEYYDSHGCNHMTCGRCSAHFCFRCGDPVCTNHIIYVKGQLTQTRRFLHKILTLIIAVPDHLASSAYLTRRK